MRYLITALVFSGCTLENPPIEKTDEDIFNLLMGWSGHFFFDNVMYPTFVDSVGGDTVVSRSLARSRTMKIVYSGDTIAQCTVITQLTGNFTVSFDTFNYQVPFNKTVYQIANFTRQMLIVDDPSRGWSLVTYGFAAAAPSGPIADSAFIGGFSVWDIGTFRDVSGPVGAPGASVDAYVYTSDPTRIRGFVYNMKDAPVPMAVWGPTLWGQVQLAQDSGGKMVTAEMYDIVALTDTANPTYDGGVWSYSVIVQP